MRRGVALLTLLATACGGSPFSVAFSETPSDDAGGAPQVTQPIVTSEDAGPDAVGIVAIVSVATPPDAEAPDASPDVAAFPEASEAAHPTTPDAAPAGHDAAPEASGPIVLSPFRCVSPSMGYVACDSGGGWTVRFSGTQTCDYSHPASVGCLQGSPCEFFQNGATPIEGTCEP